MNFYGLGELDPFPIPDDEVIVAKFLRDIGLGTYGIDALTCESVRILPGYQAAVTNGVYNGVKRVTEISRVLPLLTPEWADKAATG